MTMTIGKIRLPNGLLAELGDDGKWKSEDGMREAMLNASFPPSAFRHPACLPPGSLCIREAAKKLGAEVVSAPEIKPVPEGAVS